MYKFTDINESAFPMELSVQTIFNGINLEKNIKGFRTLAVYGRELNSNSLSVINNQVADLKESQRIITVEYELKATDNRDFREQFELLNYFLQGKNKKVTFTDDLNYYYLATLQNAETIKNGGNVVKSSFDLLLPSPFKISNNLEVFEVTRNTFKKITLFPVKLEKAKIEITEDSKKVILKNETIGKRIILNGDFKRGDFIILDFKNLLIENEKHKSLMNLLDITSNFEDFNLSFNNVISINNAKAKIEYRETRL